MKEIQLTQGFTALIDDEDFEAVSAYKWYVIVRKNRNTAYAVRGAEKQIFLHRFIWELMGNAPARFVDHKDRNGLNDVRSNLRAATRGLNRANAKINANSASGFKGVHWRNDIKLWRARISVNKERISLGQFVDVKDAAMAYDRAAKEYFGEFANLNFPGPEGA